MASGFSRAFTPGLEVPALNRRPLTKPPAWNDPEQPEFVLKRLTGQQ